MIYIFAFFDGDNVGDTIQKLLLENKFAKAKKLSDNINDFQKVIVNFLKNYNIEILLAGGDDLLIKMPIENKETLLKEIRTLFYNKTGLTLSCGVGKNVKEAIFNLHLAKLYGRNLIIE